MSRQSLRLPYNRQQPWQTLFDKECIAEFRQIPYEELSQNSFNEELASIAPINKDYNSEQVQEMSVFYGWDEAVVDIYQALTEPRPYKTAMIHHKAMTILNDMAEKGKLDKQIVMNINKKYGA